MLTSPRFSSFRPVRPQAVIRRGSSWLFWVLVLLVSPRLYAQTSEAYVWKNATILGGGFVSGVVYSQTEKDLVYARTDVGGAYRWDAPTSAWVPLTDFLSASDENFSGIVSVATDPTSPNRVYMATGLYTQSWAGKGAIFTSTNKGTTWTRVNLPIKLGGNEDGRSAGERLQVDPNLGSTLLLGSSTDGLWRSTDYGATWRQATSFPVTSSPIGSGGIAFVLFDRASSKAGSATKTIYVGVLQNGTTLYRTTDDGATWKPLLANATFDFTLAPYAASSTPHWIGDVDIDPFNSANAWFVTGYGVFGTNSLTAADAGTPVKWSFQDQGLEETVATGLISPPSGAPLISALGDIDGFRHERFDASPTTGRLSPCYGTTTDIDFAQAAPSIMVRGHYNSGAKYGAYSTDGGSNWLPFGSFPTGTTGGGTIAVSANGSTFVWAPSGGATSVSTDKGATWKAVTGSKAGLKPVADRVNPAKFYSYDGLTGTVWVSTDGGATFVTVATGLPTVPDYQVYLTTLTASFGAEGDLWLTNPVGLYHSTNSGVSFSKVASANNAARIALGKAAPGKAYPAAYIVGTVNNQYAVYRSDDTGATWIRVNDNEHQYFGIRAFAADARTYGQVYLGTSGRGILVGSTTVTPPPVVVTALEPGPPVQVSPNPSAGQFRLQTEGPFTYVIYDLLGRLVETGMAPIGDWLVGGPLRAGAYMVWIHTKEGQAKAVRLIKQ